MTTATPSAEAGPSRPSTPLGSGATPYHDSSQFRHWRFSPTHLRQLRQTLNEKAHEVTARNTELEKVRLAVECRVRIV
jgi:cyclin H